MAMSATQHHQYQPLQPRQIRVLELLPGINGDELTGSLTVVSLDDSPIFEALSYVWGSDERVQMIHISDHGVGITASLFSALTRIRLTDNPRILWIDALCINQDDVGEKERQIPLMSGIFGSASCVVADLGEASEDSDAALDLLERYLRTALPGGGYTYTFGRHLSSHETAMFMGMPQEAAGTCWVPEKLPDQDSEQWVALLRLTQRPWFSRVWIVQEFVLARDVIFYCGTRATSWSVLYAIGFDFEDPDLPDFDLTTEASDMVSSSEHFSLLFQHRALRMLQQSPEGQALLETLPLPPYTARTRSAGLIDLLHCYQYSNSTIDRDRYYALAGLALDLSLLDRQELQPDYTTDNVTWNLRMSKYLLRLPQGREMFMHSGLSSQADLSLPSWIQTFGTSRKPGMILSQCDLDITVAAGGDGSLFLIGEMPGHSDAICLAGYRVDEIRESFQGPPPTTDATSGGEATSTSAKSLLVQAYDYVHLVIDTFLSVLQPGHHRAENCSLTIEPRLLEAVMMAVFANTNTQKNALLPPCTFDEMLPELCRYLDREEGPLRDCARCRIALAEMVPAEYGHDSIAPEGLGLCGDDKDQEITRADGDEQGGGDADADSVATEEPSRSLLGYAMMPKLAGTTPSTTVAGRYAGAPSGTEAGDEIWIFAGCRLPAVVRRSVERPGMHRLVGFCYLDRFLDDGALMEGDLSQKVILY